MELVLIRPKSLVVALNDSLDIVKAWRVRRSYRAPSCVMTMDALYCRPDGPPRFVDGGFETDALGCMRLLSWLMDEHPQANPHKWIDRLEQLFEDNPRDGYMTALRILFGLEAAAPGELAYFCRQQWQHHPAEMGGLAQLGQLWRTRVVSNLGQHK